MTFPDGELRGQMLVEANTAPDTVSILTPVDGATISIEGSASTMFTASWNAANDAEGNEVVYIYQLSSSAEFDASDLLINTNVGTQTEFATDFETMASILDSIGVDVGGSATLYTRVIASDGSNSSAGEPSSMDMSRGRMTGTEHSRQLPDHFALHDNYPNPFNPSTAIQYDLPKASDVTLTVYNLLGSKVATLVNSHQEAGTHTVQWTGKNQQGYSVSTGVYFYRITAGDFSNTRKMIYMK